MYTFMLCVEIRNLVGRLKWAKEVIIERVFIFASKIFQLTKYNALRIKKRLSRIKKTLDNGKVSSRGACNMR